jgi:hypothetical protein
MKNFCTLNIQTLLMRHYQLLILPLFVFFCSCKETKNETSTAAFELIPSDTFYFKSFVDCNMAEAWIGDTLRIFPGKYGEDPVWGESHELKYADGKHADEVFQRRYEEFTEPVMPPNAPIGKPGLHGAVWFETVYQSPDDKSGKTLYALYHNENYPSTLPYDSSSGEGYIDYRWPQGLTGPQSPAAVCRIGIMKSTNGGHSWQNKGIVLEDLQPRMLLILPTHLPVALVILQLLPVASICIFFMANMVIPVFTTQQSTTAKQNGADSASVLHVLL